MSEITFEYKLSPNNPILYIGTIDDLYIYLGYSEEGFNVSGLISEIHTATDYAGVITIRVIIVGGTIVSQNGRLQHQKAININRINHIERDCDHSYDHVSLQVDGILTHGPSSESTQEENYHDIDGMTIEEMSEWLDNEEKWLKEH